MIEPDYEKDNEVIPFDYDVTKNNKNIDTFLNKYIKRPFRKLDCAVGVQFNFNKEFNRPMKPHTVSDSLDKVSSLNNEIELLESRLKLSHKEIRSALSFGLNKNVSMKPSEIEWVGDIPSHWKVERIVDYGTKNKVKNKNNVENNLLTLTYGRIKRKDINTNSGLLPESFETYQIVENGTLVLRLTDLQNDKKSLRVGLARERGIITSAYIGLNFNDEIYPPYIYYLLYMYDLLKVFYWFGSGLRSTMRYDEVKVIPILIPPKNEQEKIANYLDEKTVDLEVLVKAVEDKAVELKQLSRAIINELAIGDLN